MRLVDQRGLAALETVFAFLFFAAMVFVAMRFSILAGDAHELTVRLQDKLEERMIQLGRPACLTGVAEEPYFSGKGKNDLFNGGRVSKRLYYITGDFCEGYEEDK